MHAVDIPGLMWVLAGLVAMYAPTLWDWAHGVWAAETQGHELLILLVSSYLLFRMRRSLVDLATRPSVRLGGAAVGLALALYVVGRVEQSLRMELLSLLVMLAGVLLCLLGRSALRAAWFPLAFMLFALPLPYELVLAVTGPLKQAVSVVAAQLLVWFGFPVGRSGVVITIGQYQLLVVEACAGLQTMFTLEAMGLLYANLKNHPSALRTALLAVLVVPVAFMANVVRVMVLALVTFYFGDAAGQGFLHGFSGILLFLVALVLITSVDGLLGRLLPTPEVRA